MPYADLSFEYGTFLCYSRSGSVAVYHALGDPAFEEVARLVRADSRIAGLPTMDVVDLIQNVVAVSLEPDGCGESYALNGSPGCPRCGSPSFGTTETDRPSSVVPDEVTHLAWDAMDADHRRALVTRRLDTLIDGAEP
ncbi:MAG: hypothetical protein ABL966_12425 [Acidimicrobiales bacterium]